MTTNHHPSEPQRVGVIGYGEVGRTLADHFEASGLDAVVTNRSPTDLQTTLADRGIRVAGSPAEAAAESDVVFSCVWPEAALDVARRSRAGLDADTVYIDLNSVSPRTSRALHELVGATGAGFLQGCIVGSVTKRGIETPIALGGSGVEAFLERAAPLGMNFRAFGTDPERPTALRMGRSLVTKGLMALFVEALLVGEAYGVSEAVLDSIDETFSNFTLAEFARLYLVNMTQNAERRAGELEEVLDTIEDVGGRAPIAEHALWMNEVMEADQIDARDYHEVIAALRPFYEAPDPPD